MKLRKRPYLDLLMTLTVLSLCALSIPASAADDFKILLVPLDNDEGELVTNLIAHRKSRFDLDEIKVEIKEEWQGLRPEQEFGTDLQPQAILDRLREVDADLLITGELAEEGESLTAKLWLWPRHVDPNSEFPFPISPTAVPIIPKLKHVGFNLPSVIYRAVPHKFTRTSHPHIWGEAMYQEALALQSLDTCAPVGGSLRFVGFLTASLDWPPQSDCNIDLLSHATSRLSAARPVFDLKENLDERLRLENRAAEVALFIKLRENDRQALRLVPEAMRLIEGMANANGLRSRRYQRNSAVYDLVVGYKLRDKTLLQSAIKRFEDLECSGSGIGNLVCQIGKINAEIYLAIIGDDRAEFLKYLREYREAYAVLKGRTQNTVIHFLAEIGMAQALLEGGTKFSRKDIVEDGLSIMKHVTVTFPHPESLSMHKRIMEIIDEYGRS